MSISIKQGQLRKKLLSMFYLAQVGHIGSSLSCIDLLIALFEIKKEDELVLLSKGHAAGALYIVLNDLGEITDDEIDLFCKNGTMLAAHPPAHFSKNSPFASGSLGHGLSIGCGITYANKLQKKTDYTYVLMSDGETNEGSVWEAAHFAVSRQLDQLIVLIDKNNLQAFGRPEEVLGDTSCAKKWQSIGFDVLEVNGHNLEELILSIDQLKLKKNGSPKLIIANTIKGKGVSFMENKLEWHYLALSDVEFQKALKSIDTYYNA